MDKTDNLPQNCDQLKELAILGNTEAFLKLFSLATEYAGCGDEVFDYRCIGGDPAIREWIDKRLAPYAKSASDVVRGAYARMLLYDAESFSADEPQRAVDQMNRAFLISEELVASGNPHITVGSFFFHPSHVIRRTAFRLADLYYSLSDFQNTSKFAFYALDTQYYNTDALLKESFAKVTDKLSRLFGQGEYGNAIGIFHQFVKLAVKYEEAHEFIPIDEEVVRFVERL